MADFRFETVDSAANETGLCCLALDKAGNPRIAFAGPNGEIKLGQRNAGAWSVEDVPGNFISATGDNRVWLQIDSLGNPQVAYVSRGTGHLTYGVKRDNQWTFREIPITSSHADVFGAPINVSFVLHPGRFTAELRDTPHFFFCHGTRLGYTRLIGGDFKPVDISPEATESGMFTSAVVDSTSEEINIAYVANLADPERQMLHSMRVIDPTAPTLSVDSGTLSLSRALGSGVFIEPTSIAGETAGQCVACFDRADGTLKAAIQDSGVLSHETVARNIVFTVPSVAKHRGQFRVVFADGDGLVGHKVKLASRDRLTNWAIETVDATGGAMPSLAFDDASNCHIGYVAGSTLKYATRKEVV